MIPASGYVSGALYWKAIPHAGVSILPPGYNTASLPPSVWWTTHAPSGQIVVVSGLGAADQSKANQVIQGLNPLADMNPRTRWEIMQGVMTLSADQLSRAWQDLANGYPDKLQLDQSKDAVVLDLVDWLSKSGTAFDAAHLDELKQRAISYYTVNYPYYLMKPAFDPTIDVNGYEAA